LTPNAALGAAAREVDESALVALRTLSVLDFSIEVLVHALLTARVAFRAFCERQQSMPACTSHASRDLVGITDQTGRGTLRPLLLTRHAGPRAKTNTLSTSRGHGIVIAEGIRNAAHAVQCRWPNTSMTFVVAGSLVVALGVGTSSFAVACVGT
jgi:hypothetical protein